MRNPSYGRSLEASDDCCKCLPYVPRGGESVDHLLLYCHLPKLFGYLFFGLVTARPFLSPYRASLIGDKCWLDLRGAKLSGSPCSLQLFWLSGNSEIMLF